MNLDDKRLLIGLGTGRCGTSSLKSLVDDQPGAICLHELHAREMAWQGAERGVESAVRELESVLRTQCVDDIFVDTENAVQAARRNRSVARARAEGRIELVGDVGFYYLPYVELIEKLAAFPVRFVCMQRRRDEVVASYVAKMETTGGVRNHWTEHPDPSWIADPIWDKCYPTYSPRTLEAAIARYHDHYAEVAAELAAKHESFAVFDIELLNDASGRERILAHAGFDAHRILQPESAPHENALLRA